MRQSRHQGPCFGQERPPRPLARCLQLRPVHNSYSLRPGLAEPPTSGRDTPLMASANVEIMREVMSLVEDARNSDLSHLEGQIAQAARW